MSCMVSRCTCMDIRKMYTLRAYIHACAESMHIRTTIYIVTVTYALHCTHTGHKVMWHWSCVRGCGLYNTRTCTTNEIYMHNYVTSIVMHIHTYTWHDMTWSSYTWVCTWWKQYTIVIYIHAPNSDQPVHIHLLLDIHMYMSYQRWYMHAWPCIIGKLKQSCMHNAIDRDHCIFMCVIIMQCMHA